MKKPTYEQLEQRVLELEAIILKMQEKIEQLEARLSKNSKNSSKPPSSDQKPNNTISNGSPKLGPFHRGISRKLLPEVMITSRETRKIDICPKCGSSMELTGESTKWQQIEFPVIKPLVHQIELLKCQCPKCRLVDIPKLSENETFLLGPRLEGLTNLLMTQFRQGHKPVREFLNLLIPGLCLSQGVVSKIKKRAASAFNSITSQLKKAIVDSGKPIHGDATGWRHQGKNQHALIFRSGDLIHYSIVPSQNGNTISQILGSKPIKLVSDRGFAGKQANLQSLQYCLAHLLRNIEGASDHPSTTVTESQLLGEVHETLQGLFHDKHRFEKGEINRSTWQQYGYVKWSLMHKIIEDLLEQKPHAVLRRFCNKLLRDWKHFMLYLSTDGPMTNNPAEEALRNLVIMRKLCFGSKSDYGLRWRETLQSCVETLKRQGKSVIDFLAETIHASRSGSPYPSFL